MNELPPLLAEHLRRPRGAGKPTSFDAEGRGANPACGDDLRLYVSRTDGVLQLWFEARACSAVIASASFVVEELTGADASAARSFDVATALEGAGGLPRHRAHAARVVQRALGAALDQLDRTAR